ncbi:MAG: hypothetical protein LBE62_09550 [Azonexus sp.]|jgi:hypothetical protein|nr:hypothetical protein [Azonexus sp.]
MKLESDKLKRLSHPATPRLEMERDGLVRALAKTAQGRANGLLSQYFSGDGTQYVRE